MSDITTAGTWIRLPTTGGADDRARADQSGDAALFQILASNGTLATRENGLRTLWERGPVSVWADCMVSNDPRTMRWSDFISQGVVSHWAGEHRVRPYGEQQRPPRLILTARGVVDAVPIKLGIIVLIAAIGTDPALSSTYAIATTTSVTPADLTATLVLTTESLRSVVVAPLASGSPPSVPETGQYPAVNIFVGAWSTADAYGSKTKLGGMTLYLDPPV